MGVYPIAKLKRKKIMEDGQINPDSENGKIFGFTSELFEGYLWKKKNDIYISLIISKQEGKGNLKKLFNNILGQGFNVKVPTPFPRMQNIVSKLGFIKTFEQEKDFGDIEVWCKNADEKE